MKINAVISKPTVKINSANKTAIASAVIIAVGIIIGSLTISVSDESIIAKLMDYFISFATDFTNKNKPKILSGIMLSNLPYLISMLILGTSVFGTPAVVLLTAGKSVGMGLLTTYIYSAYSLKGIEYCLLVFLPGKIVMIFAMILLTQNCILTSMSIWQSTKTQGSGVVAIDKFMLRSVFIVSLFLLSALIDFLAIISFSQLFDFS